MKISRILITEYRNVSHNTHCVQGLSGMPAWKYWPT